MLDMNGCTRYPCKVFDAIFRSLDEEELTKQPLPIFCVMIPHLMMSPCKQRMSGAKVEMSNRVIRMFTKEGFSPSDYLRVQICDENGGKLFWNDMTDEVVAAMKRQILAGIQINGQSYSFFACSSSQMKESCFWMVCLDRKPWTVGAMLSKLGDFSRCENVSKCMARIGQCLSTTFEGNVALDSEDRRRHRTGFAHATIPDIKSDFRDRVHSDGTGLIRREALSRLLGNVPLRGIDPSDVSIIQIRFGGAKGA